MLATDHLNQQIEQSDTDDSEVDTAYDVPFEEDDDASLLLEAQNGSFDAFAELQERLMPQVIRFVRRLVGDGEVEDIVQEVFIKFYMKLDTIEPPSKMRPFLFHIARNRCYDELRKAGRYETTGFDESESIQGWISLANEQVARPEEAAHWLLLHIEVMEAMEELPEEQRLSLILYAEEGLTYAEIAELMDCSLGTVKSRIYYAKRKLRQLLHPETLKTLAEEFNASET